MFDKEIADVLRELGLSERNPCGLTGSKTFFVDGGEWHSVRSPADGALLGAVQFADQMTYDQVIDATTKAAAAWRQVPAPRRGELIRQVGLALREKKEVLGRLVSLEMGKILQEGLGEVQEMIDICDYSVGLSRQLYGLTMHSERPGHRMYEQWHPLGAVGIISAFNFPVAVWSWNAMIAAVCGNATVWKPSEKTPLCAIACVNIIKQVLEDNGAPEGLFSVVVGDRDIGRRMAEDERIPLVSATGSIRMGRSVGEAVAKRLGRSILELGGNNGIIVSREANLQLAVPAIVFGAVGTAGQRCTSTRRLIIDSEVYDEVKERLLKAYRSLPDRIGHPLDETTLVGPLIDRAAVDQMQSALSKIEDQAGRIVFGGEVVDDPRFASGHYVVPALVEIDSGADIVQQETFAPILYLLRYDTIDEAIRINNDVPQGLSSAIFTDSFRESEAFLSAAGSDCGIANVNIGTSGAEIGGAFGGEKETGGGRESGSDAWKGYMRRQTNTLNYSSDLPLAQGIKFDV
ncbi:MAG: aldehyde dehydrogenase family protein [Rhodothermales bacterium]